MSDRRWTLEGRHVVVFGGFCAWDWDQLRQRQQEVVDRIARQATVHYVERHGARILSPHRLVAAVGKRLRRRRHPASGGHVAAPGFEFLRTPLLPFHGLRWADAINARLVAGMLRSKVPVPLEECVAWVFYPSPYILATLEHVGFETIVYDAAQRYGESPDVYGPLAAEVDRRLASLADVTVVDTTVLQADRAKQGVRSRVMPQGVDERFFAESPSPTAELIRRRKALGPVAGFIGALTKVIDWSLLTELAERAPHVRFVLVGPLFIDQVPPLPANVEVLPAVRSAEVPAVMRSFDVGLIPYVVNRRTEAVLPTKLPEYLASGTRVVTTPLADVDEFARVAAEDAVEIADDAGTFAQAVERQLDRGALSEQARLRVRERFAWDVLVRDTLAHVTETRRRAGPGVALLGIGYRTSRSASDKNFMRDVVMDCAERGSIMPVVLNVAERFDVTRDDGCDPAVPVHTVSRPFHRRPRYLDGTPSEGRAHHKHSAPWEYIERALSCLTLARRLRWARARYGLVHVHAFDNLGPLAAWAAHRENLPLSVTLQASTGPYRDRFRRFLWRVSFSRVDEVLAGSDDLASVLRDLGIDRVDIAPWGPTDGLGSEGGERCVVVWSGPMQGTGEPELRLSARAMRLAAASIPGATLRVWPKPAQFERYAEVCRQERVTPERLDVPFVEALGCVRVLVSPVRHRDAVVAPPLTWLECVRRGCVVVTTPCLGIPPELIDSGWVVVAEDATAEALADAIEHAWENEPSAEAPQWNASQAAVLYERKWVRYA